MFPIVSKTDARGLAIFTCTGELLSARAANIPQKRGSVRVDRCNIGSGWMEVEVDRRFGRPGQLDWKLSGNRGRFEDDAAVFMHPRNQRTVPAEQNLVMVPRGCEKLPGFCRWRCDVP